MSPPARLAFLAGCVAVAATTGAFALRPVWDRYPLYAASTVLVTGSLLAVGWWSSAFPRARHAGLLFAAGAASWPANWWSVNQSGIGPFAGLLASLLFWGTMTFAVFAYPDDRPLDRFERTFIIATVGWMSVGQFLVFFTSEPEWNGFPADAIWPTLWPSRTAYALVSVIFGVGLLLIAGMVATLLFRRVRRASGLDRAALLPAAAGVAASAVAAAVGAMAQQTSPSTDFWAGTFFVQGVGLLAMPVSFAASNLRRRLARGGVADMVVKLSATASIEGVRAALRTALRDDSLDVFFWVPDPAGYVDTGGRPAAEPSKDTDRLVLTVAASDGSPLALVVGDPELRHHPDLVDGAVGAARLALENARLQAGLRAQLAEVRTSRARILEVQQIERRRLERDLHDGAQQRLLAVSMALGVAQESAADEATRSVIEEARSELRTALEELRNLARGIHPAVLSQSGLAAAVESLVEHARMSVAVRIPDRRWPPAAELTAYFVISEALANVAKHAPGSRCCVSARQEGDELVVTVEDDGPGDADPSGGSGLVGLRDRVAGAGGSLEVFSPAGAGTTMTARIPCA